MLVDKRTGLYQNTRFQIEADAFAEQFRTHILGSFEKQTTKHTSVTTLCSGTTLLKKLKSLVFR